MKDIVIVIPSVDRHPQPNYLRDTLEALARARVWASPRLHSVHVIDSGRETGQSLPWPDRAVAEDRGGSFVYVDAGTDVVPADYAGIIGPHSPVVLHRSAVGRRSGKQTCAEALRVGAAAGAFGASWVLHLEDDIDVCADFLDSGGRWLDDFASEAYPLYSFNGNHHAIDRALMRGEAAWHYPVPWFWGFQCFAVRPTVALSVAEWFVAHPVFVHEDGRPDDNAHDLEIHRWAAVHGHEAFLGSAPSFVQHVGSVSSIAQACGGDKVRFPSWPGRTWQYQQKKKKQEQEVRLC